MNTTTDTRVPSPEQELAKEATTNLPDLASQVKAMADTAQPVARDTDGNVVRKHGHTATAAFGEVVGAIAAVMSEIQPVEKGGKNQFHDYKYARMQDILQALTPLMGKHGIVVFQYEAARNMFDDGKVMAITYDFIVAHKSGQTWINPVPQTGMSPCRTSKGTFDDKSFAKCHTSARKYFLLSLFQIPTEDEDADEGPKQRSATPVPGPTGHVPPYYIEPTKGETPKSWATKYRGAIKHAKSRAELDEWDNLNDGLLASLDEKNAALYQEVMADVAALQASFSAGPYTTTAAPGPTKPPRADMAPAQQQTRPVRPEGCPDADKDPDGFVIWATKRMDGLDNPDDLSNIWETEITPATEGLFKPDCDALAKYYAARLAKLGA
jgi:ERF superfamily